MIPQEGDQAAVLDIDQAQALGTELQSRAQAYSDQYLAKPLQVAAGAMQSLGAELGHDDIVGPSVQQLVDSIDQLPMHVGMNAYRQDTPESVVPPQLLKLISNLQVSMNKFSEPADDDLIAMSTAASRAQASLAAHALSELSRRLAPDDIDDQIVVPSVQRFAS